MYVSMMMIDPTLKMLKTLLPFTFPFFKVFFYLFAPKENITEI